MNKTRYLTQAAIIAALYAVLTHMQNLLLPGTTTWAIQMRISEAMDVLAFFTPAAIPGLSLGCLVFNLTYAGTLPLDFLVGTLATFLAALAMWKTRNVKIGNGDARRYQCIPGGLGADGLYWRRLRHQCSVCGPG